MKKQPKQYDDDDGRVICSMDVVGTPWYDKRHRRKTAGSGGRLPPGDRITRSEARLYTWYSLLAVLLIGTVFSVTWVLFTLFCTEIWFR